MTYQMKFELTTSSSDFEIWKRVLFGNFRSSNLQNKKNPLFSHQYFQNQFPLLTTCVNLGNAESSIDFLFK